MELLYFMLLGLSSVFQVSEPPMDSSQSISGWESQDYPTSWEVQNPGPQTPQSQCQVTPNNVMRTFNGNQIQISTTHPNVASTGQGQLDNGKQFTFEIVVFGNEGRGTSLTLGYQGKHYLYETVYTDPNFQEAIIMTNGGQRVDVRVGETKEIKADDNTTILWITRYGRGNVVVKTTKEVVYHASNALRKINVPEQYIPNGTGMCKQ